MVRAVIRLAVPKGAAAKKPAPKRRAATKKKAPKRRAATKKKAPSKKYVTTRKPRKPRKKMSTAMVPYTGAIMLD